MRRALESILKINPDLDIRKATETHKALLELGRNREGQMQLVTTNFDRLFEVAHNVGEYVRGMAHTNGIESF
ncbi:MAG: hypothetical protein ISN29_09030 [Gammaproteobacteria bacterium AqS3]|nr:hypothetical protein [Gammaproteobacteria bacterium AqS3]